VSEQENRLIRCFAAVFPEVPSEEIRTLNSESAGDWNSLSIVTLTAVVEEEFKVEIEPDHIPELNSFEAFQNYLQRHNPSGN
jgi:acyl carrier protein